MSFGDFLNDVGGAVLAAWDALASGAVALWHGLDYVLQPIMSPLLSVLNPICTLLGDIVYTALGFLPAWAGLTVISIVTGVVMLIAFRYTSNQDAIVRVKDEIKAHLLALKLYKDELHVVFSSQVKLVWAILKLQRYVLTPVLVMLLPMLLGLAQMGVRYQWAPVPSGSPVIVRAALDTEAQEPPNVTLQAPDGVIVEVGPLRGTGDVAWRLRGEKPGDYTLRFNAGDATYEKELVVGDAALAVSAMRPAKVWTDQLLHPIEPPIDDDAPIRSIIIEYPPVDSYIHGSNYWVLTFFIVSMAAALILKPVFKVKF